MLITRIELENIKSYKQLTVDFQRGTTAISGSNGAGKTTLVEAIGFALFDSMPYKQDQFVREGEKYGRVVVHLSGNDDRPYVIERRCGTNALWTLYDSEADYRLEQRADVQDKLHELFGVERERSLENLFRDALGVPQGTFTAIFLQAPRIRKQTFNALLQIEDYHNTADYLLEAQKQYKEQLATQDREIQRLTFETRDLEIWRTSLQEAWEEDQRLKRNAVESARVLAELDTRSDLLKQRQIALQQCTAQRDRGRTLDEIAHQRLELAAHELKEARTAFQVVEANRPGYERYRQAETLLADFRKDERQRNALLKDRADLNTTLAATAADLRHIQQRLDEVNEASRRLLRLLPEYEQQLELEQQLKILDMEEQQYERLRKEGQQLRLKREEALNTRTTTQQRIAEIEPLRPLAEKLQERVEQYTRLTAQNDQRAAKQQQLAASQTFLKERQEELARVTTNLRNAEEALRKIDAHRQEAAEYTQLTLYQQELEHQLHHLLGNIESNTDARQRSAGGQCPLLHQTCLNIQQQGQLSLEAYFDDVLAREQTELNSLRHQLAESEARASSIKKYADALERRDRYVDHQEHNAERAEHLQRELLRQESEVERLQLEWASFQQIDQEIVQAKALFTESQKADQQTRQLPGLLSRIEQVQDQIEQYMREFEECRREVEPLKQSRERLQACQEALKVLDDPRSRRKAAQEIVNAEATHLENLARAQEIRQGILLQMADLEQQLDGYKHLDRLLNEQEVIREQARDEYYLYLKNESLAASLPERERAAVEAREKREQAALNLTRIEAAYQEAVSAFDEEEFQRVETEIQTLKRETAERYVQIHTLQEKISEYQAKIANAEALLVELEAAQAEKQTLDDLSTMMEQFRKLIKEAAPHVLRAMLSDISAEANRIFGEIMGDRSAQLLWADDYEIDLIRQGIKRSFAQLSGGEQMSAALAVRLALLKKLSTINIAFFDEPTQNMDEQRRTNLAEQIRRVRGFDQLIVISHDDTFEQGLDALLRLSKQGGQTTLLQEDDELSLPMFGSDQVDMYAS